MNCEEKIERIESASHASMMRRYISILYARLLLRKAKTMPRYVRRGFTLQNALDIVVAVKRKGINVTANVDTVISIPTG